MHAPKHFVYCGPLLLDQRLRVMPLLDIGLLILVGLAAGFIAGLVGLGGGVVFAPALFFYFQQVGVAEAVITPLTVGTSLLCTLLAASASAYYQVREGAVRKRIALVVGLFSAVAVYLMTRFVTTQPWYDQTAFQVAFSVVLLVVVARMLFLGQKEEGSAAEPGVPLLALTGSTAGAVSAAVGVGGGVVLVPAYNRFIGLPIHTAVGTSSATIVLISTMGVLSYIFTGLGAEVPATALGYVDVMRAAALALPALVSARWGVAAAHRIDRRLLQHIFAGVALIVVAKLLWEALAG